MTYVFDTNSFNVIGFYFPQRFPSFWKSFDKLVSEERIISVKESFLELENKLPENRQHMQVWISERKFIFLPPTPEEMTFVANIFSIPHFQQLVRPKQMLVGAPLADPFIIASAKLRSGCVVTEEGRKENSARIPNVCDHFGIDCINVEKFMEREKMKF